MQGFFLLFISFLFTSTAVAADILRVGLSADQAPLHYLQEGRVVGIEADNALAVGKILGRDVELVVMPRAALVAAVKNAEVDVLMSGLNISEALSAELSFIDSYLQVGQMAIMHRDKAAYFVQPWAVFREGIRLGVEPMSAGAAFVASELPDAKVSFFDELELAFSALREGEIDLFVHDAATSWLLANDLSYDDLISQYAPLTEERLAWAVRQGNAALARDLNRALSLMRRNGTLDYILKRWIPVQMVAH